MSQADAQILYRAVELPSIPGFPLTYATALNDIGQIVGYCMKSSSHSKGVWPIRMSVCWQGDKIQGLGKNIVLYGINNSGEAVGLLLYVPGGLAYGTIPRDGPVSFKVVRWIRAPVLGCISDNGDMAGFYIPIGTSDCVPCIYRDGKTIALPQPEGRSTGTVCSINEHGEAVGGVTIDSLNPASGEETLLWKEGHVYRLGTLPGFMRSSPASINSSGDVVGCSWNPGKFSEVVIKPYIWSNGKMSPLDSQMKSRLISSWPKAINSSGTVVGSAQLSKGNVHACVWDHGIITDLNDLVAPTSGRVLTSAVGINKGGQIICDGRVEGDSRAFLLTPIQH